MSPPLIIVGLSVVVCEVETAYVLVAVECCRAAGCLVEETGYNSVGESISVSPIQAATMLMCRMSTVGGRLQLQQLQTEVRLGTHET